MPQPLPRCVDRVLNLLHVATFANEDMNSPVRLEHVIDLKFNLNFGHMLTAGKRPDFLHRHTFKVLFVDDFFGHRTPPTGCASNRGRGELFLSQSDVARCSTAAILLAAMFTANTSMPGCASGMARPWLEPGEVAAERGRHLSGVKDRFNRIPNHRSEWGRDL
jgi:hypothetical protein